jgi:hypothetical protein
MVPRGPRGTPAGRNREEQTIDEGVPASSSLGRSAQMAHYGALAHRLRFRGYSVRILKKSDFAFATIRFLPTCQGHSVIFW